MKLKIETVELKHKNIFGEEFVESKIYYLIRTSLFGFGKRYLDFGGILLYWPRIVISAFLEDHINFPETKYQYHITLRKHKSGVAYFEHLEDAKVILKKIKDNPNKFIIK